MTETTTKRALEGVTSANPVSRPTGVMAPADALGEPKRMSTNDSTGQESAECPTCGNSFSTQQGMKVHHKRIHNESIAGVDRVCDYCGGEFSARQARVSRGDAKYCSIDCRHSARESQKTVGRICQECGEMFPVRKTQLNHRPAKYCSPECVGEHLARTRLGENHPNWKGGYEPYYGPSWRTQRRKALERDGHQCVVCGAGGEIHVHHVRPFRVFGPENHEQANALDNLVCLCPKHHAKWEGVPLRPEVVIDG
jgi:hypothetical protein